MVQKKISEEVGSEKTYIIRGRIRFGMICPFFIALVSIVAVSIFFFDFYLDQTLDMSIRDTYFKHTHEIIQDIIQVKKNDFMLSQNELQISQSIIQTLISGRQSSEFDPRSLGGPKLNDISYFNRYIRSLRLLELRKNETGSYETTDYEPKVAWYFNNDFEESDVEDFEFEILRQLKHYNQTNYERKYASLEQISWELPFDDPDFDASTFDYQKWYEEQQQKQKEQEEANKNKTIDVKTPCSEVRQGAEYETPRCFTKLTEQQIDDIITCAASIFIRSDFTMKYKFTDLSKFENYIGFESGIYCQYPSNPSPSFLEEKDFNCANNTWYEGKYLNKDDPIPKHYDPRCRPWYSQTYKSEYPIFTDIYKFATGDRLGITNCVPVWDQLFGGKCQDYSDESQSVVSSVNCEVYHGAYCMDMYPTSEDQTFMDEYYQNEKLGPIDYLIFTEDQNFTDKNYMQSEFKDYLSEFIFTPLNLTIESIEEKQLNASKIKEYIERVNKTNPRVDLTRINFMDELLNVGEVKVIDSELVEKIFIIFMDNMTIPLHRIEQSSNKDVVSPDPMVYKFAVILPQSIIDKKIDVVREAVSTTIQNQFVIPFVSLTFGLMIITSIFLSKISTQITQPIIELYEKIKLIIDSHQKEKIDLIKQQQGKNQVNNKSKEFNIMLNYKPRNNEINVLYLAFSNLTKTIKVARNSLYLGDDNQALLNYHEVAQIFDQLKNRQKLGSCMNNLGCIYLKKNMFENSLDFMNEAIHIQLELIEKERDKSLNDYDEQKTYLFVLACRHYNRALSRQRYIMNYIDDCKRNVNVMRAEQQLQQQHYKNEKQKNMMLSIAHDLINRGNGMFVEDDIKEIKQNLKKAMKDMISSFDQSIQTLSGVRFSVEYNQDQHTIVIPDGDTKTVHKSRKGMKSYFTDFLKMQELMSIEVQMHYQEIMKQLNSYSKGRQVDPQNTRNFNDNDSEDEPDFFKNFLEKLNEIDKQIEEFFEISGLALQQNNQRPKFVPEMHIINTNLKEYERCERFGLEIFKLDHLLQYSNYLKGLSAELQASDIQVAKSFYMEALTGTTSVNHKIRKQTLTRLMNVNLQIAAPQEIQETMIPEKILLGRYYITQKYVQIIVDSSSFPNSRVFKSTMDLPKKIFNSLNANDYFGLKILVNGFIQDENDDSYFMHHAHQHGENSQNPSNFVNDAIILEAKQMNTKVKNQYLDDITEDLIAFNKENAKSNRVGGRSMQHRNREMQIQTTKAIQRSIENLMSITEYEVHKIRGQQIMGPMKWLILILGPNHQAKDIKSLAESEGDFKNLNIIVVLVTNSKIYLKNDPMYVTGYGLNAGFKGLKSGPNKMGVQTRYTGGFMGQSFKHMATSGINDLRNTSLYNPGLKQSNFQGLEIDQNVKFLNKLARKTQEGYMITIEQRLFEGKEETEEKKNDNNLTTGGGQGVEGQKNKETSKIRYSPEVEQMFEKICQSIELYKAENIPFITEFLEF